MKSRTASRALASVSRPATRSRGLPAINARFESTSTTGNSSQPSSSEASSSWKPVLPAGQNPAYDAALSFLDNHRSTANARIEKLRSQSTTPETEAEIRRLEISSLVNDPSTRRLFRQTGGKGLMDRPVMRHLARKRWEKEGGLDRLMQRVEQLGVVPDLLGGIGGSSPIRFTTAEHGEGEVEPGSHQSPSSFRTPPTLNVQILDDLEEALYTLLVVDPDSPIYETQSFGQRLHYAKTDIKLTPTQSGEIDIFSSGPGNEVLSWEPPLPARGSGTHRYVFFLLRQPQSQSSSTSLAPGIERTGFELRNLLEQGNQVAAVTLFRSKWSADENEYIENTYREVHGTEVPVFEKAPKELKYGMPLNKKGMEREQLREEAWNKALSDIVGDEGQVKVEDRV